MLKWLQLLVLDFCTGKCLLLKKVQHLCAIYTQKSKKIPKEYGVVSDSIIPYCYQKCILYISPESISEALVLIMFFFSPSSILIPYLEFFNLFILVMYLILYIMPFIIFTVNSIGSVKHSSFYCINVLFSWLIFTKCAVQQNWSFGKIVFLWSNHMTPASNFEV